MTYEQIYIAASTAAFLLLFSIWKDHNGVNLTLKLVFACAAFAGAVLTAKWMLVA